jgi:hypothetical protein
LRRLWCLADAQGLRARLWRSPGSAAEASAFLANRWTMRDDFKTQTMSSLFRTHLVSEPARMIDPGGDGRKPSLAEIIETLPLKLEGERTTLGQLLALLGGHATALVLLVFSIPAIIPTPGIPAGFVFGTALALLAAQLVIGADRFFLPERLARINVPHRLLQAMAVRLGPKLAVLETWLKPRGQVLSGEAALRPLGLFIFVMAVLIALPIPFGNVLPGLAIFFIALGLAQRDGLAIGAGLLLGLAAIAFTAFILLGGWWLISDWLGWGSSQAPSA